MSENVQKPGEKDARRNRHVVLACIAAVAAMGALSYAAVPLYRLYCQATGFAGTTQRAEKSPDQIVDRKILIRFDANVTPGMPWTFVPVQQTVEVRVGETTLAFFRASNTSNETITGQASFNVQPDVAGRYFDKIECFCFKEQTLKAGQTVDMPVSFFVDPSIMNDKDADGVRDIILSYTFYPATESKAAKVGTREGS